MDLKDSSSRSDFRKSLLKMLKCAKMEKNNNNALILINSANVWAE